MSEVKLVLYVVAVVSLLAALFLWLLPISDRQAEDEAEAMQAKDPIDLRHLID